MSRQTRFLAVCLKHGDTATLSLKSGTQCPCMISRDPNNPQYSEEWHRNNPGSDDCNGTGLISSSTTAATIKGFGYPVGAVGIHSLPERIKMQIGEKPDADYLWWGSANSSTYAFYDLSALVEREDTVTINSIVYLVRDTYDLRIDASIGQLALLKRKA